MTNKIARMLACAGIGGFVVGWLVFGGKPPELASAPPSSSALSKETQTEQVRKEFPLRPADVQADRETPAVAVDAKGRVLLAYASQTGELERALTLVRSLDGGKTFEKPVEWRKVPIYKYASKSKTKEVTYSTHVLPRLVSSGESIHLGWVEAINGGPGVAYYLATSTDGGLTFSEPIRTHGAEAIKPGFTTLSVAFDGSIVCGWLDGRAKGPRPYSSVRPSHSEGFEPEQLAYEGPDGKGVCPCCDVAVAQGTTGDRFVAFRNSESGNRDIYVSGPGGLVAVAPDHWKLEGCPHDGPSMAFARDRLNLLWMDAHSGKNRVYHASSPSDGLAFKVLELAPASKGAQGHPKLAATPDGRLIAVWDESIGEVPALASGDPQEHGHAAPLTGDGRAIQLAMSTGESFGKPRAISPRPGAFQLQASIAVQADGTALVAWNEMDGDGKKVVFARVECPSGPKL
jgi:hypothetical protein